ncbi:MAG: DUF2066 domain-containing protein [Psychrobium sp.]|nr:DUF2066 domain-containing protein [Psychrobium sp.]
MIGMALGLTSALTSSVVHAKQVDGLYRAKIAVTNQSVASRNAAISLLFRQVLVKVSGQSAALENPQLIKRLGDALSYAAEFNFVTQNRQLLLSVKFNESRIDQLLKSTGTPIWGNSRPTVMLWMSYLDEPAQDRQVLNTQQSGNLPGLIKQHATARGLPLLLPLWDLDDQMVLSISDIWGQFSDKVAVANLRYQSDYLIIAKVSEQGLSQHLNWAIYKTNDVNAMQHTDIVFSGSDEFSNMEQALVALVEQSADYFAEQYSVDTTVEARQIQFVVENIDTLWRYAQVGDYLRSIKAISSVTLIRNVGPNFTFSAKYLGNRESLLDVIALEKKLFQQATDENGNTVYQWVK